MKLKNIQKIGSSLIFEKINNNASLWHAINVKNAIQQLENGFLLPYTKQRYWKNGQRYKDDHPEYENSFWMYGWSMTRKKEYAENWNSIVFEFDKDKLNFSFKIIPFAWNYLFKHNTKFKKQEFEEFVIAKKVPTSIQELKDNDQKAEKELDILYDKKNKLLDNDLIEVNKKIDHLENLKSWFENWNTPKGKSIDLNKCLKGIYIDEYVLKDFKEEDIKVITGHPLYKGTFSRDRLSKKKLKA